MDPRFSRLKSDPRFRRLKKKDSKVVVDERFKDVFAKKKSKSGRVDKYGRAVSDTHDQENLKRFYRLAPEDEAEEERLDLARGEVLLESSDDEEHAQVDDDADDSDPGDIISIGAGPSKPISVLKDDLEINLDEDDFADLEAQAAAYAEEHPDEQQKDEGTRTHRLAAVNLDWDHVRANHLYKICASLVSPTASLPLASTSSKDSGRKNAPSKTTVMRGKVLSVRVYPSEFGKERMAKEEKEGPPAEIFKKRKDFSDEEEVDEKNIYEVGDENEYDEDALRTYQLERLRYYYAIITCDTTEAASHIYDELEGTELERSANVFDLSFVPDDMTFDTEPRDEATEELSTSYKGVDFVTDALRHSKVKLTWDEDDPERNQVTRRTLTRKEIQDADFKAYVASSSSESESEDEAAASKKKSKKADREKLRALLLGGNDDDIPEGWGDEGQTDDVDMEITFTPGLTETKSAEDETTLDRYQKKMREKRKKKKEENKGRPVNKEGDDGKDVEDEFFEAESEQDNSLQKETGRKKSKGDSKASRKPEQARPEITSEELALLVTSDNPNVEPQHFNLKSVLKAEKKKGRKGKKGKDLELDNEIQEDFVIDVKDERFKVLHEVHQFAIDPSNPHFKKTKGMQALLEERQKLQKETRRNDHLPTSHSSTTGEKSLESLVESIKRKSINSDRQGVGKRRKL